MRRPDIPQASDEFSISFVVPALNEDGVVQQTVEEIITCLQSRGTNYELILINDGSTDRTPAIMDMMAERDDRIRVLHNEKNIGLGASYRRGVSEARNDFIMLLCGDGGLPASSLPPILDVVGKADIVIPYMTNLKAIKSPFRFILSRAYTTLLNFLFGLHLNYYNGLPVHRAELLRSLDISSQGFGFQGEILVKLLKTGNSFTEVGVRGAEETRQSSALKLGNIFSVTKTLVMLVWEIYSYVRRTNASQRAQNTK